MGMLDGIEGIIFDLDGTMVDSMWVWKEVDIEFMAERGLEPPPEGLDREIDGMSFKETAEYFARRFPLEETPEELMELWVDMAADKYRNEVGVKPGLMPFLREMKGRGVRMGIATSNAKELLDAVAESHGFYDYIDAAVTANEVGRGKPAPDVYLAAADKIDVPPGKCLAFEDIPEGIRAGLAAGMRVCAVTDDYSSNLLEEKARLADFLIDGYGQVLDGTYRVCGPHRGKG